MFDDLFLGYAIGDAFGAGAEFQDRNWIRKNVDFTCLVNVRSKISAIDLLIVTFQKFIRQNTEC